MSKEIMVRGSGKWIKISRNDEKQFTFYIGREGELKSHQTQYYGSVIKTWKEARFYAEHMIVIVSKGK